MTVASTIESRLAAALAPERIEITDDSARHRGHAGAREGGETHFTVEIVSERFEGLNRVARQRLVNAALAHELATGVHALSMTTLTPAEDQARRQG